MIDHRNTPLPQKENEVYKYSEDRIIEQLIQYVDSTYSSHYNRNKYQATEFIMDSGHGMSFCIGNVMKYAQRYGTKNGYNRDDLMKILHYGIMALHVHNNLSETDSYINVSEKTG